MGIDPGTASTGYGIVEEKSGKLCYRGHGCITTPAGMPFPERLQMIYSALSRKIREFQPGVIAIEELFFSRNVTTAISVGQARGVAILAAVNAQCQVSEYTPLQVKSALIGYGRADKRQIQEMVKMLLNLDKIPKPDDAADGLAIAICHINTVRFEKFDKSKKDNC